MSPDPQATIDHMQEIVYELVGRAQTCGCMSDREAAQFHREVWAAIKQDESLLFEDE